MFSTLNDVLSNYLLFIYDVNVNCMVNIHFVFELNWMAAFAFILKSGMHFISHMVIKVRL